MKNQTTYRYLLVEDSYLVRQNLTNMLTELRPEWKTLGYCEHTGQIKNRMLLSPDFVVADSHVSDGESLDMLKQYANNSPMIFYTHLIDESRAINSLPNIVKFIYEPISCEEMEEAVMLIEHHISASNSKI